MKRRHALLLAAALALPAPLLAGCDGDASDAEHDDDYEPGDEEDEPDFEPADVDVAPVRPGPALGPDPAPESAGPRVPPPAEAPPDASRQNAQHAVALLERLDGLANTPFAPPRSSAPPPGLARKELLQFRNRMASNVREWKAAVEKVEGAASDYLAAAGWDAAAPRAFRLRGLARAARADREPGDVAWTLRHHGAEDLERFLARAPEDDASRAEVEAALGRLRLLVAADDAERWRAALPHLERGTEGLLRAGRDEEAGTAAFLLLTTLLDLGEDGRAAEISERLGLASADLGGAGSRVRQLALRAGLRPGGKLPPLPAVSTTDGRPFEPSRMLGSPYVLHFFKTDVSTKSREIETILVPLRDRWASDGLQLVGVSIDWAMTDEQLERANALADEVGDSYVVYDGRQASVADWVAERGMDWRWYWDGKWMHNEIVRALGVPTNRAYAIVVGADGLIRWRGEPYKGLADAVDELMAQ